MTRLLTLFLMLIGIASVGQTFDKNKETQQLLLLILSQDSISRVTFDVSLNGFADYEFEGDYSVKRIFPQAYDSTGERNNLLICHSPIKFETSIHSALQTIDPNYDSAYYRNQATGATLFSWRDKGFTFSKKKKFIGSRWNWLFRETNEISMPMFNKDGNVALIKFSSVNRRSALKKHPRIWVFTKFDGEWKLAKTINSTKDWN